MLADGARASLNLSGTVLGFYPVRVLPSKTAIAPVNPDFLPRVTILNVIHLFLLHSNLFLDLLSTRFSLFELLLLKVVFLCFLVSSRMMNVRCAQELSIVQILTRR